MPERNPLIEKNPVETLQNVHSILVFMQEFHNNNQFEDASKTPINYVGLSLILKCTNEALNYEIARSEKLPERTMIFEA